MRAEAELRDQRMGWAKVEVDGRDILLAGVAPDEQARAAAQQVAAVWGARKVSSSLDTVEAFVTEGSSQAATTASVPTRSRPPPPGETFRTRMTVVDQRLVLDGAVPGVRQHSELVELAQARFGIAAVEAQLTEAANAPDGWLQAAAVALEIADELVFGEINLVEQALHVTGITATREGDQIVRELVANELPDGYSGTVQTGPRKELESVLRTSPELARRVNLNRTTATPDELTAPRTLSAGGCQTAFSAALGARKILFDTASATLTGASRQLLDELAAVLKRCSGARVVIEGHTDDQGLEENNLALSQRRAEAVMEHLVTRGISLGRLSARGYGEERPLVANETAADRAINRRIEFVFESN